MSARVIFIETLSQFDRNVSWELYQLDCTSQDALSFLRDHPLIRKVTGVLFACHNIMSVVEIDMPWNNDQVAEYGESFKAWTNEQFTLACNLVKDAAAFRLWYFFAFLLHSL